MNRKSHKNTSLLSRTITFTLMSTLLFMSVLAIGSFGQGAANAQNSNDCAKLPINSIAANNEYKEFVASNAIDNNPDTTWSHYRLGSFIQADLGRSSVICSVDIQWYNESAYKFVISVSEDGIAFRDVVSGVSTGQSDSPERYNIPDINARYVKITVNGNDKNTWADIAELAINGRTCMVPQVTSVLASGDDGNVPENTLDNNLNSRWSNFGLGSSIQYTFSKPQLVCKVDISWYRGNERVNDFSILVSNDGTNYRSIFSGESTGRTTALESYNIPDTIAKYLRIVVTGNTQNQWASINEVDINSGLPGSPTECTPPQITAVGANGNDGNIPQNTIDNNPNTRWSNQGLPSFIQYELENAQDVCDVDISWYRGNTRVNTFTISASNDGENFETIFSGESSGTTTAAETYNVDDTFAKFVRITVDQNSENNWASITEVDINGDSQAPSPTPREICGNGVDDDGDGQTDEGCQAGGSGSDPFGIEKIYPTKPGSEDDEWFMDMSDGQDPRSRPPPLTKNSDGSFKVRSDQVRYGVFTTSGYNPDNVELDHGVLAERGYMQSPNDWRDVELTGYVKMNSGQSDENFAWYARGGRHTGSGSPEGCEGSSIKADLGYDGRVRFAKEQWHVSYVFTDHQRAMSSIEDRWVGFKGIMYNIEQNGETAVKMEIWVDMNEDGNEDGPWVKVDENIDEGGWGDEGEECGGDPDQIITWGGPIATFRWDGASDVDIKNFSVREIEAPSQ
jgi:F5/8 type C domain